MGRASAFKPRLECHLSIPMRASLGLRCPKARTNVWNYPAPQPAQQERKTLGNAVVSAERRNAVVPNFLPFPIGREGRRGPGYFLSFRLRLARDCTYGASRVHIQ